MAVDAAIHHMAEDFLQGQSAASPNKKAKVADCGPYYVKLRCSTTCSLEFLRKIAQACENSTWCCSWDIIDAHGRKVDCDTAEIPDLDVEFDEPPVEPHNRDKTTNTDIPR